MSRVGKEPITLPKGVEASVANGVITIKGAKETKTLDTLDRVNIEISDGKIVFGLKGETKQDRAFWGTYRALANNIVIGLSQGFEKKLEINGVGYRAAVNGNKLEMALGYSHPVIFEIPKGIEISVDKNVISIKGADKQQVGQVAAVIREFRPPEPYKGKGVKYVDETIRRKAGKTSKK
ncbi:MAG: 50S ribosomal protein L6 [Campylobacteraceae bacterium]|jgi:large subunit ribosomal protein L6|nr:50S ribosomal protein L6 [Campylobacteraceae bacterium]